MNYLNILFEEMSCFFCNAVLYFFFLLYVNMPYSCILPPCKLSCSVFFCCLSCPPIPPLWNIITSESR